MVNNGGIPRYMKQREPCDGITVSHHWMIEEPTSKWSRGRCKKCLLVKKFDNNPDMHTRSRTVNGVKKSFAIFTLNGSKASPWRTN